MHHMIHTLWLKQQATNYHKMTEAMEFGFMKGGNDAMDKLRAALELDRADQQLTLKEAFTYKLLC